MTDTMRFVSSDDCDITDKQQRELKRIIGAIDRISEDDRAFFAANPERTFRIRRQTKVERREIELVRGSKVPCPRGCRRYTIIKQLEPGCRIRVGAVITELHRVENFSDAACQLIFEQMTAGHDQVANLEACLRTMDDAS
jgi:hypothetical protein